MRVPQLVHSCTDLGHPTTMILPPDQIPKPATVVMLLNTLTRAERRRHSIDDCKPGGPSETETLLLAWWPCATKAGGRRRSERKAHEEGEDQDSNTPRTHISLGHKQFSSPSIIRRGRGSGMESAKGAVPPLCSYLGKHRRGGGRRTHRPRD